MVSLKSRVIQGYRVCYWIKCVGNLAEVYALQNAILVENMSLSIKETLQCTNPLFSQKHPLSFT